LFLAPYIYVKKPNTVSRYMDRWLKTKKLPFGFFCRILYIQNRTLSSTGKVTPYEALLGRKPNISNLRIFGSPAFVHVPDARRQKLDPKAIEGIFVGCSPFKKAYRIWVESKRKIEVSRNVVVDESNNLPLMPDALQSTSQSTPFDLFLPP
jgi:hypothetical protein